MNRSFINFSFRILFFLLLGLFFSTCGGIKNIAVPAVQERPVYQEDYSRVYFTQYQGQKYENDSAIWLALEGRFDKVETIKFDSLSGGGKVLDTKVEEGKIEFLYQPDKSSVGSESSLTQFMVRIYRDKKKKQLQGFKIQLEDYSVSKSFVESIENPGFWKWIPIESLKCRDASSSGLGFRASKNSKNLLIFLKGGGICFNEITCNANPKSFNGIDWQANTFINRSILNASEPTNPFKDWNVMYYPYCSGDVFSGNNPEKNISGFSNFLIGLREILPAIQKDREIENILLVGTSAGGLGVLLNFEQLYNYLENPKIKYTVIDNAGVVLLNETFPPCFYQMMDRELHFEIPPDIADYSRKTYDIPIKNIYEYTSGKYPNVQFGLSASYQDLVFRFFYGFGADNCNQNRAIKSTVISGEEYTQALLDLEREVKQIPGNNWSFFFNKGNKHVLETEFDRGFSTWMRNLVERRLD
ncbi:MAG: hypothetical protein C4K58_00515 [Flavobacteriaceae bacterium]|nr:MAG: hypothetical protein C4K58_00515 [Flavobacteriaceae bacterium]